MGSMLGNRRREVGSQGAKRRGYHALFLTRAADERLEANGGEVARGFALDACKQ